MVLWNLSENNKAYKGLKIDKNRQGELGKIGLEFVGENMRFEERTEDFQQFLNKVKQQDKNAEDLKSFCSSYDNPFE